jgi:hypothetical protein
VADLVAYDEDENRSLGLLDLLDLLGLLDLLDLLDPSLGPFL